MWSYFLICYQIITDNEFYTPCWAWGDVGNKGSNLQLSNQTYRTCKISYFYHSKDSQVQNTQKCRVDNDFNLLLKRQYFILLSQNNKIIIIFWFHGIIYFRNLFANERFWCQNVAFTSLSSSCSATQLGKDPFYSHPILVGLTLHPQPPLD